MAYQAVAPCDKYPNGVYVEIYPGKGKPAITFEPPREEPKEAPKPKKPKSDG